MDGMMAGFYVQVFQDLFFFLPSRVNNTTKPDPNVSYHPSLLEPKLASVFTDPKLSKTFAYQGWSGILSGAIKDHSQQR